MGEGEKTRLVAWYDEMKAVHGRLRRALELVLDTAGPDRRPAGAAPAADASLDDLLVYCRGFCTALTRHHTSEDTVLFPELEHRHPELGATLRALRQDHSMIAYLVTDLEQTVDRAREPGPGGSEAVLRHLEGVGAIMESHFRYEEKALGEVLTALDLDAAREVVLGPL
ncbi:hemerythrin domain-containing protein [Cellulosimicrobium terreum]|nr:hemerythrin domain-containing protein [Cellulosimicrobium terreum]